MLKLARVFSLLFFATASALTAQEISFDFIGQAQFPTGYFFEGVALGGLSGISYLADEDVYYCISDDRGRSGPPRYYTLKIALADGSLRTGDVSLLAMTTLQDEKGQPHGNGSIDPEGIALFRPGQIFVSSEGGSDPKFKPFIRKYSAAGSLLQSLPLPKKFMPTKNRDRGLRNNLGFEALAISPDGRYLFSANENALAQDGPLPTLEEKSPVRIMKFDLQASHAVAEYLYWVEPIDTPPTEGNRPASNGLVEFVTLHQNALLGMERRYAAGVGTRIRLFEIDLSGAQDIAEIDALSAVDAAKIKSVHKTPRFDSTHLGIKTDNIEGMTFGPRLPSGKESIILVSDNNFNPLQFTQFLGFAITRRRAATIGEIQGAAHISPLNGTQVEGVRGIVTAIRKNNSDLNFWIQDPVGDDDACTSDGILVCMGSRESNVKIGDEVEVAGLVTETGQTRQLSVTCITEPTISILGSGRDLPPPVIIGVNGRKLPQTVFDDDGLAHFQPEADALDLYESLEGMRVEIQDGLVLTAPNRFSEFYVLADSGKDASTRSRGGIVLRDGDLNPERILIACASQKPLPDLEAVDLLKGPIIGVVDYSFGNYKVWCTSTLPVPEKRPLQKEATTLVGTLDHLTVATYNVENLDFKDRAEQFARLSVSIVENLKSPDILALQEVQDDNGPADEGVTSASATLGRLVSAIAAAGGPAYAFAQVDPVHKSEGGQPVGNIRVAFLYDPARVSFEGRGESGPDVENYILRAGSGVQLAQNPGRIGTRDRAFAGDKDLNFFSSRRPLVAEFGFNGKTVFIVNNHFSSKGGDDGPMGGNQPPMLPSELQRREQARFVNGFVSVIVAADSTANVIVIGDLNEHEFRSPVQVLCGEVLINLMEQVPMEDRYTYVFSGNSQLLDHILISQSLNTAAAPEIDIVHINAEFASKKQASDHDPVIARLRLARAKF